MSDTENKRARIEAILSRVAGKPAPKDAEESLFDSGYLDSFALADMVTELEKEFGVQVPDADLKPRRFETISRIEEYLDK